MLNKKDDKGWVTVGDDAPKESNTQKKSNGTFEVNGEKFDPYAMTKAHKIPLWVKAVVAKWWFPGAVFYFISFGIEGLVEGTVLAVILGLVWGIVIDVLLNHFFRESSQVGHDYTRFIFCGRSINSGIKRFLTLPVNLVYGVIISYISATLIDWVLFILQIKGIVGNTDSVMFYAGPILYATFMLAIDEICVELRNLVNFIIKKIKEKRSLKTLIVSDEISVENSTNNIEESTKNVEESTNNVENSTNKVD